MSSLAQERENTFPICCSVLQRVAACWSTLENDFYRVRQRRCVAMCCSVCSFAQCVAVCCSTLENDFSRVRERRCECLPSARACYAFKRATRPIDMCAMIVLYSYIPCDPTKSELCTIDVTLQHTTTHCNTLQHTAIHCNTLNGELCTIDVNFLV